MTRYQLQEIHQTLEALAPKRWIQSEAAYQQACTLLPAVLEDPARLPDYVCSLSSAIRAQPRNPEPYCALARVHLALQDPAQARACLDTAIKYAPGHTEALRLQAQLSRPQAAATIPPADEVSLQAFETGLRTLLLAISQEQPAPSPGQPDLIGLHARYAEYQVGYRALLKQLAALSAQHETGGLALQLLPLERALERLRDALQAAEGLLGLSRFMARIEALVLQNLRQLPRLSPALAESRLEIAMDACDLIADRLDAFSEAGIPVSSVIQAYRRLMVFVERWQELLDDPPLKS